MFIVNGNVGMKAREVRFLKDFDRRILALLKDREMYPMEMAKALGVNEQTLYYHVRKLEAAGFIRPVRSVFVGGIRTTYYALTSEAFFERVGDFHPIRRIPSEPPRILKGIVENGEFVAKIVVGSPMSHGELGTAARDIEAVSDLGLFLGSFLNTTELSTVRDTFVKDLTGSFVVVGGPLVNMVMKKINSKLPIRFEKDRWKVFSRLTKKRYVGDDVGIVMNVENPFSKRRRILVVAGCTHRGTRAAVVALVKHSTSLSMTNVVRGLDLDSDGVIDDAKVLE